MPLNIHVEGDLGAIRGTASSLRRAGSSVDRAGRQVDRASSLSGEGWHGGAGDTFRSAMGRVSSAVGDWATAYQDTGRELDAVADRLSSVRQQMERARGIAAGAGLVTTAKTIADPGPGVAPPGPQPVGPGVSVLDRDAHAAAVDAFDEYQRKVLAFRQASEIVASARQDEKSAQDHLTRFLTRQLEHPEFLVSHLVTGVVGASIEKTSKYRDIARGHEAKRARWERLANSKHLRLGNRIGSHLRAGQHAFLRDRALQKTTGRLARATDDIPDGGKTFLTARLGGKLPVIGTVLTAAQTGLKIQDGMHPAQAITSGAGSLMAGMAVGAMVGGPVGAVAGMAVAAGVGYVVDEWGDDLAEGVGDAASGVGEGIGVAADAVGDLVSDVF